MLKLKLKLKWRGCSVVWCAVGLARVYNEKYFSKKMFFKQKYFGREIP